MENKKPLDGTDILLYLPDSKMLLAATIGTGDQLLPEDAEEGYVDYIDVSVYAADPEDLFSENGQFGRYSDGGVLLLKEQAAELYPYTEEGMWLMAREAVCYMLDSDEDFIILHARTEVGECLE